MYKTSMATGKEEGTCDPVLVPVLQNTRPLKEGEELLTYNGDLEVPIHSMPRVPAITQSPKKRTASLAPAAVQPPQTNIRNGKHGFENQVRRELGKKSQLYKFRG